MKDKKGLIIFFAGPLLLLMTMGLLFAKTALLLGRPVWIVGMSISTFLAMTITYLSAKELLTLERSNQEEVKEKEKEISNLHSLLDETHLLYRKKVDQLEKEFSTLEQTLSIKDQEIEEMKVGYEKVYEELSRSKSQANAFHSSLEDALGELREARQTLYFEKEGGKHVPKDLVHQHRQLREQFEEKGVILEQTRRRLFAFEGHLIALKKERGEEMLGISEEITALLVMLKELDRENQALEKEVELFEKLIETWASSSVKTVEKGKKKVAQMLEFQFGSSDS